MQNAIKNSLILILFFALLCCGIYPLVVWGIGNLFFPDKANGSFIHFKGKIIGSKLIGQKFSQPKFFQGRLSAAGKEGYKGTDSAASNLGPSNITLIERIKADVLAQKKMNAQEMAFQALIPSQLVTASASGLDPHISVQAALFQVKRIAEIRKLDSQSLIDLVSKMTQKNWPIIGGTTTVSVLELNLSLESNF